MTELELRLVALGRELEFPPEPELAPRLRARLAERPARAWRPRRQALVLAFVALAVAIGAAFAVPPARTAILEFFGLRGVEIERVSEPPVVPAGGNLGLGRSVTLAEARGLADYEVVLPGLPELRDPEEVYFTGALPGGHVAFVYGPSTDRLLLTQFQAEPGFRYIEKTAGPGTEIEPVTVNGDQGFWITGEPHAFVFADSEGQVREETLRLAGNVLLWQRGELTLRLEGAASKAEALLIARSVG